MSFAAEELRIKSETPEKQIEEIRRWGQKLVENLNYTLNHLDSTYFTQDQAANVAGTQINEVVQEALNSQYTELRTLTIARTKGKGLTDSGYAVIGDIKICWGIVEISTTTAGEPNHVTVSFPVSYTNKPNMQVSCQNSDPGIRVLGCSYDNLTKTGCDIFATRTNVNTTKISWIAIGK